ncbi:MAG: DUF58 domain-containing protein [Thermoplasmata archaeon]
MSSMQLTKRGRVLLLVPVYLFIGAYFLQNPFMAMMGAGLLSLFLYSRTYLIKEKSRIDVDTVVKQDIAYVDEGINITHSLESPGPLRLSLDPDDDLENKDGRRFDQLVKSKALFEYTLHPTTPGKTKVGALNGTLYDPMGLYRTEFNHPAEVNMIVYPSKEAIRHAKAYAHRVHLEELVRDIRRFTTTSGELEEIREYHPGDRWRDIHWKSVSKFGKLMTKEYEKVTLLECCLFLDMSPSMRRGKKKHNHVTFLTIELLKELELSGHDIGLTVYDHRDVLFYQKPEQKRATFNRMYKAIVDIPPPKPSIPYNNLRYKENVTIHNLRDAERQFVENVSKLRYGRSSKGIGGLVRGIKNLNKSVHKRSLAIFITDMETRPELTIKSVEKLKAMKHSVWVIIPFSPWYEAHGDDENILKMVYQDYLRLEAMIRMLYKTGAKVFEMHPGKEGLRILEEGR